MNKQNLPTLYNYGYYSSDNYGAHTMRVQIPATRKGKSGITLYYSYDTIVAFRGVIDGNYRLVVHKNEWGVTTGKHLNMIDGGNKDARVDDATFEKLYKKAIKNA